ncbi:MAG: hypothetical protein AAGI30_12940 [Planctomycetota bacterium]
MKPEEVVLDTKLLARALQSIQADYKDNKILEYLNAVLETSTAAQANPADTAAQERFSTAVGAIRSALAKAQTRQLAISVQRSIRDAKLESIAASHLSKKIESILGQIPFIQASATKQFQQLVNQTQQKWKAASQIFDALESLGIMSEEEQNEYEVGILMPTSYTNNDLRVFDKQIEGWTRIVDALSELAYGSTSERIRVTGLGRGSFELFFELAPWVTLGMLTLGKGVLRALRTRYDTQQAVDRLREIGHPKQAIDEFLSKSPKLVDGIRDETLKAIFELIEIHPDTEKTRANELNAKLSFGFEFALKSANQGVDIEVSVPEEAPEVAKAEAKIEDLHKQIDSLRLELLRETKELPDRTEPLLEIGQPEPVPSKE